MNVAVIPLVDMKLRFSLRALLIVVTALAVIVGFRLNQRSALQIATKKIRAMDGTVFYSWQLPELVEIPIHVPNAYWTVRVPYTEKRDDGTLITKTRTEVAHQNRGHTIISESFRPTMANPPGFQIASCLLGSHNDVAVTAVSIPASAVDKNTVKLLSRMRGLKQVLLLVDQEYFSVKSSTRATQKKRNEDLKRLGKNLQNAKKLIELKLPDIMLFQNGIAG